MLSIKRALTAMTILAGLSACAGLSDQDRALLSSANQNADQAKQMAQQALTASQAAQASANAANEKADRMFQRGLRK